MRRISKLVATALAATALMSTTAQAQLTWTWSFGSESGTFTTTGSSYAPGNFGFLDFSVTSSGAGSAIGSMSGGQYDVVGSYLTQLPYDFDWDGSAVTRWNSAGSNTFDWWVFNQTPFTNRFYFFGWGQNNVNAANQAAVYFEGQGLGQPSYTVTVAPARSVVPEPSSVALLAAGMLAISVAARRRRWR